MAWIAKHRLKKATTVQRNFMYRLYSAAQKLASIEWPISMLLNSFTHTKIGQLQGK